MNARRLTTAVGVVAVPVIGIAVGVHLVGIVLMTDACLVLVSAI